MTANRLAIALIVLVVILHAVSLGVGSRNHDGTKEVDPEQLWLKRFVPSEKFDLSEISPTNGWEKGRWTLQRGVPQAVLDVGSSHKKLPVRNLLISVAEDGPCQIQYKPRPDPKEAGKYVDEQAAPLPVQDVISGKPPVKLTILTHGGFLIVHRVNVSSRAVLTLE